MKTLSSRHLLTTPIFTVTEDIALDPEGFEVKRAIVRHYGSAVVMPVDARGRILLVQQFRLPAKQNLWELPAGLVDEGETPLKAARRELAEETGYRAGKIKKLMEFFASPGFLEERLHLYVATDLKPGKATPMDDERIETRWFTSKEMDAMIQGGKLIDAKTMLGYLHWKRFRGAS